MQIRATCHRMSTVSPQRISMAMHLVMVILYKQKCNTLIFKKKNVILQLAQSVKIYWDENKEKKNTNLKQKGKAPEGITLLSAFSSLEQSSTIKFSTASSRLAVSLFSFISCNIPGWFHIYNQPLLQLSPNHIRCTQFYAYMWVPYFPGLFS